MAWLGFDPDEELQWIDALSHARFRGQQAARGWSVQQLGHASRVARTAPWLKPGVLLGLGKGTTSMEPVQYAAELAARQSARTNPTNRTSGQRVRGADLSPGDRRIFEKERFRRSQANAAQQYVGGLQRQGAGVQYEKELRDEGLLDEAGAVHAPAELERFVKGYKYDPEMVSKWRSARQVRRINRFTELVRAVAGDEGEVTFRTPSGIGAYNAKSDSWFVPEEGVQAQSIRNIPGAAVSTLTNLPSIIPVPGGAEEEIRRQRSPLAGLELAGRAVERGLEGIQIPQANLPGTEAAQMTAGPTSAADIVQQGFMGIQAPAQELQGFIRKAYGDIQGRDTDWFQPQSDFLISLTTGMDPGEGLLGVDPDSAVAKERLRREEQAGLIGGQRVTAGRWLASTVTEPGTDTYRVMSGLVDAGIQLAVDPTILVAGRLANIRKARTMFAGGDDVVEATGLAKSVLKPGFIREKREGAGLVDGLFTNDVHGPTGNAWMIGEGSDVVESIRQMTSPYEIWLFTNRKLLPKEVKALARAETTDAVRDELRPLLGQKFRTTRDVWNNPAILGPQQRRGMTMMPHSINPQDPMSWMTQTERWMRGTRVPDERQVEFMDRMANAESNNGRWDVLTDVMADREGVLADAGVGSQGLRKRLTTAFRDTQNNESLWFVDEMGDNVSVWHDVAVGDDVVPGVGPQLSVEHIGREIPLPNVTEIRSLTSKYPNLTKLLPDQESALGLARKWPVALVDAWQNDIWKPFTLLRAAWPMRVIGEEQLRMGAAGLHSMFSGHPISAIAWAIGRTDSGRLTRRIETGLAKAVPGVKRRGAVSGLGEPFQELKEFETAMVSRNRAGGFLDERPGRVRTNRWRTYDKSHEDYVLAWSEELALLRQSPEAVVVAQSDNLDDAVDWFRHRDNREFFDEMIEAHPELTDPLAARRWLETVAKRIDVKTGGNVELVDAIRTGKLNGENWLDEGVVPNRSFRKALESRIDAGPQAVKGRDMQYLRGDAGSVVARGWRHGVDWAFSGLMSRPTNYLSRSSTFRQFYWQRGEELIRHGDEAAKATFLENAKAANMPKRMIDRMERTTAKGTLNAEELDALAKGYGLDETKRLLYDLGEKSLIAEQMRLVSPFAEAWREVMTRWASLANPATPRGIKNIRRFQQAIQGARGSDFGEALDVPKVWDPETEKWTQPGFFWKDEFGEEVFIMPGTQWLMGQDIQVPEAVPGIGGLGTPGIPIPLTGRVQGLNMIGQVFPGVGPVAAVPVSFLLPDKPGFRRQLRDWLLPFGSLVDEGGAEGWAAVLDPRNYLPPWMKTGLQALINGGYDQQTNRLWANAEKSAANYLYSTGRYDTTSKAGKQKLLEDAREKARSLYFVRSLVAFGAPTAPSPKFLVDTNQGLIRLAMLRDDYYKLLSEDPTTADEEFLARWGDIDAEPGKDKVGLSMQAFTREIQGGVGVSVEWGDWATSAEAQELKRDYPGIWAYLGPQGGDFDYDTYLQQLLKGQRETLTLEEWYDLGQQHLGRMHIDRAEREIAESPGDEDEDALYLADIETWVYDNYPGYLTSNEQPGTEKRLTREDALRELASAMEDERVTKTTTGAALKDYWGERQVSVDYAASLGTLKVYGPWYDLSRSKDLADDRAFLYDLGQWWAREDEGFKALWNRHLRAEVEPSDEELAEEEEAA